MALALLYTVLFALCGLCVASVLFRSERLIKRIWYGLVFGLLLLTWLPSLFAFIIGFNTAAQIGAGIVATLLGVFCAVFIIKKSGKSVFFGYLQRDFAFLWIVLPLFLLGAVLFSSHILKPLDNGGVAVGQVTYGDLAMHLGFISSIAVQGTFPPEYSIFPGHTVNYPFLCETSASSLVVLGANLRQAYLITALYAYLLVLLGVWFFFREWLHTNRRVCIATLLFFLGSGFGFAYWFDLAKQGASLNTLLDGTYFSNFSWLLDGFYDTPTNLPTIGLRWVNPIVDMLIPQRATLFGWAFLFPCLTLLHGFTFYDKRYNVLPLGLIAGLMPLIHTHSFLALGIISAVYCIRDLITHFNKKRLALWALYAGLACIIGMPQLFGFAFAQASESGMVKLHWNWANEADSYLWFYLKNWGWLFALLPVAFLTLSKRDRHVFLAPLLVWVVAEIVVFQPNHYDNNKLLFITFAFVCGLVGKWLDVAYRRVYAWIRKRSAVFERIFVLRISALLIEAILFISLLIKLSGDHSIAWYTICTLLFLAGLCLFLLYGALREAVRIGPIHIKEQLTISAAMLFILWPLIELLYGLWRGYAQTTLYLDVGPLMITLSSLLFAILFTALPLIRWPMPRAFSAACHSVALQLTVFVLTLTLSLSSTMTILRELKSEYQVYSEPDLEVSAYIRENTEADDLFLANSYLWNLVTPTTGRSIVTGTSTFLFFHGIDNTQREADVRKMYEEPASSEQLFRKYGVDYVLVSNAERYQYQWDEAWFEANGTVVFANAAARIYRLNSL